MAAQQMVTQVREVRLADPGPTYLTGRTPTLPPVQLTRACPVPREAGMAARLRLFDESRPG